MQSRQTTNTATLATRLVLVASVVLLAASCSDGDTASTTTAVDDGGVAVTAAPIAIAASEPPPGSYSDVQADFEATTAPILAAGRAVVEDLFAGDFQSVVDQLDETMAALVSVEDLEAAWSELNAQAPVGATIMDRAAVQSGLGFYGADLSWGDGVIMASAAFDHTGQMPELFLNPQTPLPEDPFGDYVSSVEYRVPFEGLWYVAWGGRTELQNYHVIVPSQRHALDLLIWKDGATHTGDGTANEDYWAYGQSVVAPADGTVVTVVDGLPDQTPQTAGDGSNPAGNYVVIKVAEGEYVWIAHLQPGSIVVAEGDSVISGQQIGLVGNSGSTSEPHIHIHVQDRPTFGAEATGIPMLFSNYIANGEPVAEGELLADQFVGNG